MKIDITTVLLVGATIYLLSRQKQGNGNKLKQPTPTGSGLSGFVRRPMGYSTPPMVSGIGAGREPVYSFGRAGMAGLSPGSGYVPNYLRQGWVIQPNITPFNGFDRTPIPFLYKTINYYGR